MRVRIRAGNLAYEAGRVIVLAGPEVADDSRQPRHGEVADAPVGRTGVVVGAATASAVVAKPREQA
jgi:hypothetical protein